MLSQAVQDYLKTIYKLEVKGPVSTTRIAKELSISGASVTGMLKRLSTMSLVDYNSYKGVKLTESGRKFALEIIRNHRLLELYLKEMIGFPLEKVHEEACRLEHYVSEEFISRIDELLGFPHFDPHGHPIPTDSGDIPELDKTPLSEFDPGENVIIKRIADTDAEMLAYFEKMRLVPGAKIKILEKAPFNGPITIEHLGNKEIVGNEIARNIFVSVAG